MKALSIFIFLMVLAFSVLDIRAQKLSTERSRTQPIEVGQTASDFALKDDTGKTVTLSAIKEPTIIVFYRAYW